MSVRNSNPTDDLQNQGIVNEALEYVLLVVDIRNVCLYPNERAHCDDLLKHMYSLLNIITVPNERIIVKRLKKEAIRESVAMLFFCMSSESYAKAKMVLDNWMIRHQ